MKTNKIDKTLKNILKIDNQCKNKEKEKNTLNEIYQKKLVNEKRRIDREYMKEARSIARKQREKIYKDLDEEVAAIENKTKSEVEHLNFILENNINDITEKIFNKILENI